MNLIIITNEIFEAKKAVLLLDKRGLSNNVDFAKIHSQEC